jgi:hypothetical protein
MKKSAVRVAGIATSMMTLLLTTAAVRTPRVSDVAKPTITVYKDPSCGCCRNWIQHLIKHGYRVDAKDTPNMAEVKRTLGVPDAVTSCHTAMVNGYLIEGHVPSADIDRLLAKKPHVAGLAVPGMPTGSPGMEGARAQHYQVLSFDRSGKTQVFASY